MTPPNDRDPRPPHSGAARVIRLGGRLILFHPSVRTALAARHGRVLDDDDTFALRRPVTLLAMTGWTLGRYDDADHRFFALARRTVGIR